VIGGYTLPEHSRIGFGSLLLGYYKKGKLMYAGKVGTGFSDDFLKKFIVKLEKIETVKNPFSSKVMEHEKVRFVKPLYVAAIGFENWTKNNLLRQPRFQGLRFDKDAKDVVQEKPELVKIKN
jgi:ATP-dependent DNA ligase